jgi:hypothetical protein
LESSIPPLFEPPITAQRRVTHRQKEAAAQKGPLLSQTFARRCRLKPWLPRLHHENCEKKLPAQPLFFAHQFITNTAGINCNLVSAELLCSTVQYMQLSCTRIHSLFVSSSLVASVPLLLAMCNEILGVQLVCPVLQTLSDDW